MPSIDELKSLISTRNGLAVANRYQVTFGLPAALKRIMPEAGTTSGQVLNLMCDAAGLPGRQIATVDYQAQKQSIKIPYAFINEDVTFTFLLTGDYYAKKIFDAWSESIIDFSGYRVKYLADHVSDIRVFQQVKGNNGDTIAYGIILKNAYPTTFSGIALDNASENTIQKYQVVMTYENFEVIK